MRVRSMVLVAVVAVVAAACAARGAGPEPGTVGPASVPAPAPAAPSTTSVDLPATIRVTQHQTSCCFTEGQISFLRISRAGDGEVVVDRGFDPAAMRAVLVAVTVPPGVYRIESRQRPCAGSCPSLDQSGRPPVGSGALDPPTDRCAAEFDVSGGETFDVLVEFAPTEGCTITFPDTRPASDVPDEVALREAYPNCGFDLTLEGLAEPGAEAEPSPVRRCLLDAFRRGEPAELTADEPTDDPGVLREVVYRVERDGGVVLWFHFAPKWDRWFRVTCAGLREASPGVEFEPVGCSEPAAIR